LIKTHIPGEPITNTAVWFLHRFSCLQDCDTVR